MGELRLSALESAVTEANAIALGATVDGLMENAGRSVAEEAVHHLPSAPAGVAILAGPGNNGGDGTCAAHYLRQWGYAPEVWLLADPAEIRSAAARRCFDRIARELPIHLGHPTASELSAFPLVVDALLGTGGRPGLTGGLREAADALRSSNAPVLSVDVPSGVGGEGAVAPNWTVALTAAKAGTDAHNSGAITVRDIGIPAAAWEETGPGEYLRYPLNGRARRTRRVLVLGGGPFPGAAALAALAALRAGAERATVLCPARAAPVVQSFSPVLVVEPVGADRFGPKNAATILRFLRDHPVHAVALGMGAGREAGTVAALAEVLGGMAPTVPRVIDADGLEAAPLRPGPAAEGAPTVLTPNLGELARLGGLGRDPEEAARVAAVQRLAVERRALLLAKGDPDLIGDGERLVRNRHHHPAAMVAGVGDVLSGVVAALLAEGLDAFGAARLGAYWVGDAGVRAYERRGYGVLATDVLEELPGALLAGRPERS